MRSITYKVLRHDGGWAYRVNGACSETFPTREKARKAARRAAWEQAASAESSLIDYEDGQRPRYHELSAAGERPKTPAEG